MKLSILSYFTDSVLRAPTLGSMLMCLSAGLMGVIVYLRRQSLIGEVLSHACYPGVIVSLFIAGGLSIQSSDILFSFMIFFGAFITSYGSLMWVRFLEEKLHIANDVALCFVLSSFFGIGITLVSEIQFSYTSLYTQALTYFYGQAATMTDIHIMIYGVFSLILIAFIVIFYKELQISLFNYDYAKSLGMSVVGVNIGVNIFIILSIVIGIRSVGVVLMSAMLVAPVVAARRFTHHLPMLFVGSGFFALISGFLGNYLSVEMTAHLSHKFPSSRMILPTGPMIVLVSMTLCLVAFLFSPQRGLLARIGRILSFRYNVACENLLKEMWKQGIDKPLDIKNYRHRIISSSLLFEFVLRRMTTHGWLKKTAQGVFLTEDGFQKASRVVRLHRLWELYLTSYLGMGHDRVHRSAEEMEHILTPDIEKQLTDLLGNPKQDPHSQPIPSGERGYVS